jgi:hypothetical protein
MDDKTQINHRPTLLHKKQRAQNAIQDEQILASKLHEFKNSPSSLRISASHVSALVGLHPYQNLPQLLFDFVYQSYLGQKLLQIDATALGLSLVDAKRHEEEQMLSLATTVSKETKQLIQQVLEVSSGKRKLESVDQVQSIQKKIATQAQNAQKAGRMSQKQVDTLVEASRGHVSTGFGTCHEEEALDIYEKRMGCLVRERNEDLMEWRFEKIDCDGETGVSAAPMGKAMRRRGWMAYRQQLDTSSDCKSDDKDKSEPLDVDTCKNKDNSIEEKKSESGDDDVAVCISDTNNSKPKPVQMTDNRIEAESSETIDCESMQLKPIEDKKHQNDVIDLTVEHSAQDSTKRPFFKIVGAVDGVRDEIYIDEHPSTSKSPAINCKDKEELAVEKGEFSDDEIDQFIAAYKTPSKKQEDEFSDAECNMVLRPIIVECKHRMKKAQLPPPLYDQIQTCIYCQMHETSEADLIQVVRNQNAKTESSVNTKSDVNPTADNNKHIEITISRISLNDPIHNHKYHWTATILPRLVSPEVVADWLSYFSNSLSLNMF